MYIFESMAKRTCLFKLIHLILLLALVSCEPEDTSAPVVEIINPAEDLTVFNKDTVLIHIEATDNEKVKEIKLLLDNTVIFSSKNKPYLFSLNCEGLIGNRIIQASAIDVSGNIGESKPRILSVLKNESPHASFIIRSDFGLIDQEITVDASLSSDDEDSLAQLQFRWDWETDGTFDTFFSSNPIKGHTYNQAGTYTISLEVKDRYHNLSQFESSIIVQGIYSDKRDGQEYKTIKIGDQTWFAENLNYSQNGWCYDENINNCTNYGRLYSWTEAANNCPEGWHLSTDEDWKKLEQELGMPEYLLNSYANREVGKVGMKIKSQMDWELGVLGTDEIGFNALAAGNIDLKSSTYSYGLGEQSSFWTSIEFIDSNIEDPIIRLLQADNDGIVRDEADSQVLSSARCVEGHAVPILINPEVIKTSYKYIVLGFEVLKGGGDNITETGLCWSMDKNPTIDDNFLVLGSAAGIVSGQISDLEPNQSYFIRSYARNKYNISYGRRLQVSTSRPIAPKIQKLGTIDVGIVESSPIVFNDRLYRFEYIRQKSEHNSSPISFFHFVDTETGETTPPFAQSYHLGSAFVHEDSTYVTVSNDWGGEQVFMYVSADLIEWKRRQILNIPGAK